MKESESFFGALRDQADGDSGAVARFLRRDAREQAEQVARQLFRFEVLDCAIRGLMPRRSPYPDPGVIFTPMPSGILVISETHRRGELLVVVAPPVYGERIMYRPDREGG